MAGPPGDRRGFRCTPGGAVAAGRRRLRRLLGALALFMLALAVALWLSGRILPGLLAAGVGLLVRSAWRLGGALEPLWLRLDGPRLILELRRGRLSIPVEGATARSLRPEEVAHLERLASLGGIVAGSGGFDSHLLGEFDLYASDLASAVLVDAGETRLVVTPDDPEEFLRALAEAAERGRPGASAG